MNQVSTEGNAKSYDVQQIDTTPGTVIQGKDGKVAKRKRGWGPVQPERKSKRVPLDGVTMLEKAQALKSKNNLENEKGKKVSKHISTSSLLEIVATSIDLEVPVEELSKQKLVDQVLDLEIERNNSFNVACSTVECQGKFKEKDDF